MSAREAEVLDAVAAHLSNAQIAGRLHISVRTVESHVRSLLRKFGAADRRELAALAPAATSQFAHGFRTSIFRALSCRETPPAACNADIPAIRD